MKNQRIRRSINEDVPGTSTFPKVGDNADVVNVSGAPSDATMAVAKPSTVKFPRSYREQLPHRQPKLIDAESGLALGDLTEQAAADAARRIHYSSTSDNIERANAKYDRAREAIDASHPSAKPMLSHLFGLDLPDAAADKSRGYGGRLPRGGRGRPGRYSDDDS